MSRRILVVEDQEDNRRILHDLLTNAGYEIVQAENGVEALRVAAAERPDLILMDIQLPLLDGYEATRHLKADPGLRAIPIIVITSYALSGDESRARAAGCGWSRQSAGPGHSRTLLRPSCRHADQLARRTGARPSRSGHRSIGFQILWNERALNQ